MSQIQTLQSILDEVRSLEPLPQVALRVMSLSGNIDLVPSELVEVIQTDAGLTAKVLKLCNSAYYGFRREIASMSEAGNLLGCSTLVNLVVTSCAAMHFRNYGGQSAQEAQRQWERAIMTAIASSLLARASGNADQNRCYTIGLLQNVGHLVMERFVPQARGALDEAMAGGATRLQAEHEILGIHHGEIGAQLAERWDFPDVLVDAIRHHHEPHKAHSDHVLASIAHLGEMVAQQYELGEGMELMAYEFRNEALGLAGMTRGDFESLEASMGDEVKRAKDLINLH